MHSRLHPHMPRLRPYASQVFVLGRMGLNREALELMLEQLRAPTVSVMYYALAGVQNMVGDAECLQQVVDTESDLVLEALLDAADRMGMLVWDENHRNGQDDELRRLVLRDRNHPSIVLWSICNEKLCDSSDTLADAKRLHALFHALDPGGGRVVSANYNGWLGPDTPLDVQGIDYATQTYDEVHESAPA